MGSSSFLPSDREDESGDAARHNCVVWVCTTNSKINVVVNDYYNSVSNFNNSYSLPLIDVDPKTRVNRSSWSIAYQFHIMHVTCSYLVDHFVVKLSGLLLLLTYMGTSVAPRVVVILKYELHPNSRCVCIIILYIFWCMSSICYDFTLKAKHFLLLVCHIQRTSNFNTQQNRVHLCTCVIYATSYCMHQIYSPVFKPYLSDTCTQLPVFLVCNNYSVVSVN